MAKHVDYEKCVIANNGYYGRIITGGSNKERIAIEFDDMPGKVFVFQDRHARKIGWYMLKQGFINPLRNLFKK